MGTEQLEWAKLLKRAAGIALSEPARKRAGIVRVISYARASTKKQDMSIHDQLKVMEAFRAKQKGWASVGIFSEVQSGKGQRKRGEYQKIKAAMRAREVDVVLSHDFSRWGRSLPELVRLFELAEKNRVQIWTVVNGEMPYVTSVALAMVADLMLGMAREQIKRAHYAINMDGRHVGGKPYGYRHVRKNGQNGHLQIVSKEAKIVRQIYRLYLEGKSPMAICRILNAKNIPSPGGKKWRVPILTKKDGFRGILHNDVYRGWVFYDKSEKHFDPELETVSHKFRPAEEWKRKKGQHTAIITPAIFDAVQERFRNRPKSVRPTPGPPALFAGKLKCAKCLVVHEDGTTNYGTMKITGGGRRNQQTRIQCNGISMGYCTNGRSYMRSLVFEAALNTLRENLKEPKVIEAFLREHSSLSKAAMRKKAKELSRLGELLERLHNERDNLINAIRSGGDPVLLNGKISEVQLQIAQAKQEEDAFRAGTYEFKLHAPSARSYLKLVEETLHRLTTAPAERIDLPVMEELNSLVERIVVHPKEGLEFEVEIVGKLARIVSATESIRSKGSIESGTLTEEDAAEMLRITYPKEGSRGMVPFHKRVEEVLVSEVKPVTIHEIHKRLAERGVAATPTEVERAVGYRRDVFVNIRRNGFMLKTAYDELQVKWFETTDSIIEATEKVLRSRSEPATTEQILTTLREQGFDIHGDDGAYILRKSMSKSGRFLISGRKPTSWQLKPVRRRALQRSSKLANTSGPAEPRAASAV
ncbi:recombinase family protein [Bradyrhizobium sp. USDA 4452]